MKADTVRIDNIFEVPYRKVVA